MCHAVKSVPEMTYNVFSGMLNPTHFTSLHAVKNVHCKGYGTVCYVHMSYIQQTVTRMWANA